jgi:hypothetical protein
MTADGNEMVMPVAPMFGGGYGGNGGFGNWGSDIWIILLVLFAFGGFGGFGGWGGMMGGFGGFMGGYDFPWLLASNANNQNATQNGFNQLATNQAINGLQQSVTTGFGDVQLGIAGVNQNICQTGNQVVQAYNAGQMANMQQLFGVQTAMNQGFNSLQAAQANCCCENRLAVANLGSDIAREACATRTSDTQNTQLILNAINDGFRAMSDQRFQDKIDAKNDEIAQLRQENLYARGQASQIAQDQRIVDNIYNRLSTCPVDTTPVYGRQPIFTCPQNQNYNPYGCGCGCNVA